MLPLILAFFIIALLYATVGFGGGTFYIAILALVGTPYLLIPKLSLICNILVVSGGCYHYARKGHLNKKLILPFILSSIPMAYLGGTIPLSQTFFYILLTSCLLLCAVRLLFLPDRKAEEIKTPATYISFISGGVLGLLSGMVGIGGGIFLSPLLINLGWARSKDAAGLASIFILVNSLAGFLGQTMKDNSFPNLDSYLPLFLAVIIGGQIGSRIGTHSKVSYGLIQKGTGILTLLISMRLLFKAIN